MRRKGILGLETVRAVIMALLILGVLTIAVLLALVSISPVLDNTTRNTVRVINESGFHNSTVYRITTENSGQVGFGGFVLELAFNTSDSTTIDPANVTLGAAGTFTATTGLVNTNSTDVQYTYLYTFRPESAGLITRNISSGTARFFQNVPTFMILLGVVVILLIIGLVIFAVNRFSGSGGGSVGGLNRSRKDSLSGGGTGL